MAVFAQAQQRVEGAPANDAGVVGARVYAKVGVALQDAVKQAIQQVIVQGKAPVRGAQVDDVETFLGLVPQEPHPLWAVGKGELEYYGVVAIGAVKAGHDGVIAAHGCAKVEQEDVLAKRLGKRLDGRINGSAVAVVIDEDEFKVGKMGRQFSVQPCEPIS